MGDLLFVFNPFLARIWLPLLVSALGSARPQLNLARAEAWLSAAPPGFAHPGLREAGPPLVFDGLELMGGAAGGQRRAQIAGNVALPPAAPIKRLGRAIALAGRLVALPSIPLTQAPRRSARALLREGFEFGP